MTLGLISAITNRAALADIPIILVRDVSGLIFRDDFNRADSATVGNGWTERAPPNDVFEIDGNRLGTEPDAGAGIIFQAFTLPDNMIIQANAQSGDGGTAFGDIAGRATPGVDFNDGVKIEWNEGLNRIRIVIFTDSILRHSFLFNRAIVNGDQFTTRLVFIDDGTFQIKGFQVPTIGSLTDLTSSLTEIIDELPSFEPNDSSFRMVLGGAVNFYDEFFGCGRDIYIEGLSTNDKARLIGNDSTGSLVVESGGKVTFPVSGTALPLNMIEVTDNGDVLKGTFNAPNDIWGGDSYSVNLG